MTGLNRDTQFESLDFQISHKCSHARRNSAEIVVLELLVLACFVTHKSAACEQQVGASGIQAFIYKEIFLFPTEISHHLGHFGVEIVAHFYSCLIHGMECLKQRSLIVEALAGVGDKHGRDAQSVVDHKHRRRGIPCAIAACLEGVADTAVREARCVGLLLHKQFSRKFLYHTAFAVVLHKCIVLLGCAFGKWLEPVCVVCCAQFGSPFLHSCCHAVGYRAVECRTVVDCIYQLGINCTRKILKHLLAIEHILAEIIARATARHVDSCCFLLESFFHNSES